MVYDTFYVGYDEVFNIHVLVNNSVCNIKSMLLKMIKIKVKIINVN